LVSLDPYQYRENARGNETLTGFDVEIERAVARVMGVELLLQEISWDSHLAGLETGARDIAAGTTYSSERDQYAYFSKPYRRETDVLILLRGTSSKYSFETIDQMLDFLRSSISGWELSPGLPMPINGSTPTFQIQPTWLWSSRKTLI
jgi:polar amino acid transport system substrate-binding protein